MSGRIVLVGCVEAKALEPPPPAPWPKGYVQRRLPARDLYVSPLFRKRRAYAEREVAEGRAARWAILSALYRIVPPEKEVPSYDWTMSSWRKDELETWARQVVFGFEGLDWLANGCVYDGADAALEGATFEVHAGVAYVDPIRPLLEQAGATVETPLAGLGIGEQLSWYTRRLDPQLSLLEHRRR